MAAELGSTISKHEIDNRPRRVLAGWGLVVGALATVIAIAALSTDYDTPYTPSRGYFQGAVVGLALTGWFVGLMCLIQAIRAGGHEAIEVREGGLVHRNAFRTRAWAWNQVASFHTHEDGNARSLARFAGWNYRARVGFVDGGRLSYNATAGDFDDLTKVITEQAPPSATDPANQKQRTFLWLWLALACAVVCVGLIIFIGQNPDTEQEIQHDGYTEVVTVPGLSDTGWAIAGIGIALTGLGAFVFLVQFVVAMVKRQR